jgi:hypothetical protein
LSATDNTAFSSWNAASSTGRAIGSEPRAERAACPKCGPLGVNTISRASSLASGGSRGSVHGPMRLTMVRPLLQQFPRGGGRGWRGILDHDGCTGEVDVPHRAVAIGREDIVAVLDGYGDNDAEHFLDMFRVGSNAGLPQESPGLQNMA